MDRYIRPIGGAWDDVALLLVDAGHLAEEHRRILLATDDPADRIADLPRRENGSRHLVEQRHEHVVVVAVDQDHLDRRPAGGPGGPPAAGAPPPGARGRAWAAASPPKPPPTMTTRGSCSDMSASILLSQP